MMSAGQLVHRSGGTKWTSQRQRDYYRPCLHTAGRQGQCLHSNRRRLLSLLSSAILAPAVNPLDAAAAFVRDVVNEEPAQQTLFEDEIQDDEQQGPNVDPPTYVTATGRIVAIGDLHGDWDKAIESFRVAGLIEINNNDEVNWCGGDTVVVQLGDVLDRGDHEIGIVRLLRAMNLQAREQGGAVYMLNGNHESLNVCGDFKYVTPAAVMESAAFAQLTQEQFQFGWEFLAHVREKVYMPGGPMARELAKNPTVLVVNDTVFAHGGLLPEHAEYGIEKLNHDVAAWMRGDLKPNGEKVSPPFIAMGSAQSVMWTRAFSREHFSSPIERYSACNALKQALAKVGGKRLVVGHTPQLKGVNCECDGAVWRVDVGMSRGVLNKPVQVLEITTNEEGDTVVNILPKSNISDSFDDDLMTLQL